MSDLCATLLLRAIGLADPRFAARYPHRSYCERDESRMARRSQVARQRERRWDRQDLGRSVRPSLALSRSKAKPHCPNPRTASPQRNYAHTAPVNDIALHSNQGELISCDQSGAIKIWDLGGDCCSHELVRRTLLIERRNDTDLLLRSSQKKTSPCGPSRSRRTDLRWSLETTECALALPRFSPSTEPQPAGSRLRLDDPSRPQLHRPPTENQVPGAQSLPHQSPRFSRHQVRPRCPSLPPPLIHCHRNLATCSADTTIKIWSTNSTGPANGKGVPGSGGMNGSPDGAYKLDKVLQGHQRWVWDMAYSADSAYLVSGEFSRCDSPCSSLLRVPWCMRG